MHARVPAYVHAYSFFISVALAEIVRPPCRNKRMQGTDVGGSLLSLLLQVLGGNYLTEFYFVLVGELPGILEMLYRLHGFETQA